MLARETGLCLTLLQSLARRAEGLTSISVLAQELGLSRPYAAKLCKRLRDAGYLETRKGARGGVGLTSAARERSLFDLAADLADPFVDQNCVLLRDACSTDQPCPMHEAWSALHASSIEAFRSCRITDTRPQLRPPSRRSSR